MDYEKKYNEALERAQKAIRAGGDVAMEIVQHIFPELRESEDERIRKYLIEELKAAKSVGELKFIIPQPTREECIVYLEKQKERGPLTKEEEYTLQRIIEYLEDETCPPEWISLLHDIYCLPYEKQKEQKPAVSREEILHQLLQNGSITLSDYLYLTEKQKPAEWSEEDNNMWTHLNGYLNGFSCSEDAIKQMADWFYELPDRFNLQPKQEWSEEDEKIMESLISLIETIGEYYISLETIDRYVAWLKFLRPSWKPSKQQMGALHEAVIRSCSHHYGVELSNLEIDLLNLK